MQSRGGLRVINSVTPLSELVNYSTFLRTLTSGTSTFTMEFDSYHHMNDVQQKKAIQQMTGFAVN
jgi:elongation factor G